MSEITLLQCCECRFKFSSIHGYKCPKCQSDDLAEEATDAELDAAMARIDRIWPERIPVMPVSTENLEALAKRVREEV